MFNKKSCRKRNSCNSGKTFGIILMSVGFGMFLAYIIPYYLLITMLGLALFITGLSCILKK